MRPGAFLQPPPTGAQLCPTGAQPGPTWNAAWVGHETEKIYSSFQLLTTVPASAAGADANVTADANAATPVADADNVDLVLQWFDSYFITNCWGRATLLKNTRRLEIDLLLAF